MTTRRLRGIIADHNKIIAIEAAYLASLEILLRQALVVLHLN